MKEPTLSVPDMAAHLAVSERQLYRLTNSLTGCSPAQLIKEVRLKKAYDLLVSGDIYKVEDVAKRVGFENPSYFSRQFHARFGKRPVEFL
jgi:transcriptional regulator GlxA family with amidase domain